VDDRDLPVEFVNRLCNHPACATIAVNAPVRDQRQNLL
jgi:hypothetical protein